MMNDFNNYMDGIKTLTLDEKKDIVLEQLKILSSMTNTMCRELEVDNKMFVSKDLIESKNSDDDFLEAMIVYLSSSINSLCDLTDKITDLLEDISNE